MMPNYTLCCLLLVALWQTCYSGKNTWQPEKGWTEWSDWSSCSRSCDGGAAYQLRRCLSRGGCLGQGVKYKICNMQPCPVSMDFRAQQCSAFDTIPYKGTFYTWQSHYDTDNPCSLTCKATSEDLVVQLAPRVQDGTRCRPGSLDMCIDGKCQIVGCDLKLGSSKRIDACGVCGGNATVCEHGPTTGYWDQSSYSVCSASCGGGEQTSKAICRDKDNHKILEDYMCDARLRPDIKSQPCNTHRCPARWVADAWSSCTRDCGSGVHYRTVWCAEDRNMTKIKVPDSLCPSVRPRTQEPCNTFDCPKWFKGEWSSCSVTCGEGHQSRQTRCRDARGLDSTQCDEEVKPPDTQICRTGIPCPKPENISIPEPRIEALPLLAGHTARLIQPPPPRLQLHSYESRGDVVPSEPTYIIGNWRPCSVSCGDGVRVREVNCKIFLEFSRTIATLPDNQCPGRKPSHVEKCYMQPCALSNRLSDPPQQDFTYSSSPAYSRAWSMRDTNDITAVIRKSNTPKKPKYTWKNIGFKPCSASCLGGVQESLIECVRTSDNKLVNRSLCPLREKPDAITRTCNDQPCPPRWNVSDFSPCSRSCGNGVQIREVECIHEVARGGENTMVVSTSYCPQPPPRAEKKCNNFDCPVQWSPEKWTKCSAKCGGGYKTRKIKCQQTMALGAVHDKHPSECPSKRPRTRKICNKRKCGDPNKPVIQQSNNTFYQKRPMGKISLKVGGKAVVYKGTTIKVRCPVKRFNRSLIFWDKNFRRIRESKKIKVSRKGTLRIRKIQYKDSGQYRCIAAQSSATIYINVRPDPSRITSSEETGDEDSRRPRPTYKHNNVDLDSSRGRSSKPRFPWSMYNNEKTSHESSHRNSWDSWQSWNSQDKNRQKNTLDLKLNDKAYTDHEQVKYGFYSK